MRSFISNFAILFVAFAAPVVVDGNCPCWTAEEIGTMTVDPFCEFYNENDPGQGQQGEGPGWQYGYVVGEYANEDHYDAESFAANTPGESYCVKIIGEDFVWMSDITFAQANACLAEVTGHCAQYTR